MCPRNSWVSHALAWLAVTNFILAEKATIPVQRDVCKANAVFELLGLLNMLRSNQPWQNGGHIFKVTARHVDM